MVSDWSDRKGPRVNIGFFGINSFQHQVSSDKKVLFSALNCCWNSVLYPSPLNQIVVWLVPSSETGIKLRLENYSVDSSRFYTTILSKWNSKTGNNFLHLFLILLISNLHFMSSFTSPTYFNQPQFLILPWDLLKLCFYLLFVAFLTR